MISEKQRGLIFVLVGPGGTGKNTLMNKIMERHDNIKQLATATTRPMRPGEQQNREHQFVTFERFQEMIANKELLEYQEVTPGRLYGIPRTGVEAKLDAGQFLVADIDVYGAKVLKNTYPDDAVLIFVTVPGDSVQEKLAILRERMLDRFEGEPTASNRQLIQERLQRAQAIEFPFADQCDFMIVNDNKEEAVAKLHTIITTKLKERSA